MINHHMHANKLLLPSMTSSVNHPPVIHLYNGQLSMGLVGVKTHLDMLLLGMEAATSPHSSWHVAPMEPITSVIVTYSHFKHLAAHSGEGN